MSEYQNEKLQAKCNVETIIIFVHKKFKEGQSDVVGVLNSCRVINDMMNDWIETRIVQNIVNEKNEVINRDQNWAARGRIIGLKSKRAELCTRTQNASRFYELKSCV